jgi:salicylate hydroxylase
VTWWTGPDCHLVHYPIAGGTLLNLAASHADGTTEPTAGVPVAEDTVRAAMAALGDGAHRLLALGRDWRSWSLVDRDPVDRWTDGRVALLGDAAHPMLHYLAQGACVGLEDAVLLGALLDCPPARIPERLRRYGALRRERTARMQLTARESIRLWHAAGATATARDAALGRMSETELYDRVAWMHAELGAVPAEHGAAA